MQGELLADGDDFGGALLLGGAGFGLNLGDIDRSDRGFSLGHLDLLGRIGSASDADGEVGRHADEGYFVGGPAGDAVGFVIAAFGFEDEVIDGIPHRDVLTDAIHHVAENLLGPRASPEADDGATYPVGVNAD